MTCYLGSPKLIRLEIWVKPADRHSGKATCGAPSGCQAKYPKAEPLSGPGSFHSVSAADSERPCFRVSASASGTRSTCQGHVAMEILPVPCLEPVEGTG